MLSLFVDSEGRIQTEGLSEELLGLVGEISSIVDFLANLVKDRKRVLAVDRSLEPKIAHLLLQDQIAYKDVLPNAKYGTQNGLVVIWQPWWYVLPEDDFDEIVFINNFYGVDSKKNASESGE
jgi:hypothetical protein